MSIRNPRDIEQALYSTDEFRRLASDVDANRPLAEVVFEFARSGAVIADYAIRSGRQRTTSDSAAVFGVYLQDLWETHAPDHTPSQSVGVTWLSRALVTVAAFASSSATSAVSDEHQGLLVGTQASLDRLAGDGPARGLVEMGRGFAERIGYKAGQVASRARRPWDALDSLVDVASRQDAPLDGALNLLPLEVDALMEPTEGELSTLMERAAQRREGRPARGGYLSHSSGRRGDIESFAVEARQDEASLRSASQGGNLFGLSFRVWYGTDRKPADRGAARFLNERDPRGILHTGVCVVNIPETHQFASTGPGWFKRWTRLGPGGKITVGSVHPYRDHDEFVAGVRDVLDVDGSARTGLLYVHGFANTFSDAAIKAAQLGCDLKINGVAAMYSWPSYGSILRYRQDGQRVEQSEDNFIDFVELLAARSGLETLNIIAHSMGGRLLSRTIDRIATRLQASNATLGTIILAAPDVDVVTFRNLSSGYRSACQKSSMYVSDRDMALQGSMRYWGEPRVGLTPPVTVTSGIDTIDAGGVDLSFVGHGYYAQSRGVLLDIYALLGGQWNPSQRPQLVSRNGPQGSWWAFT